MITVKSPTITPWPAFTYLKGQGYRILMSLHKMPECPECKSDELTFIQEKTIVCMSCHTWYKRHETPKRF